MQRNRLLNVILKVQTYSDDQTSITIGTAFLVNKEYAVTAYHVIEDLDGQNIILTTNDENNSFNCSIVCGLKEKTNIDIAILKLETSLITFDDYLGLCSDDINVGDLYSSYGYPELNEGNAFYFSGQVISPEGRLSIKNSTGTQAGDNLYRGVSGAPLIIDSMIYGIIVYEQIATDITKPEFITLRFNTMIENLNYINRNELQEQIYQFILKYCKPNLNSANRIDPFYEMYDGEYSRIKDKRNMREKVLSVCPNFSTKTLNTWQRKSVRARLELKSLASNQMKAVLMGVFSPCIDYIDEHLFNIISLDESELKKNLDVLEEQTIKFINERKKDYDYGAENKILFINTIYNLIDSCFLSFGEYAEEDENDVL